MSWKCGLKEQDAERLEKSYISLQQSTIIEENNEDYNNVPKNFLKRSSKKIVGQKLKWKAQKRIDCWLSRDSAQYSREIEIDLKPYRQENNIIHLAQLEEIFLEMSSSHQNINDFLDQNERKDQKIPQLSSNSKLIVEFVEDKYQDIIEILEQHYNNLCSDELINK